MICIVTTCHSLAADQVEVTYPSQTEQRDLRNTYPLALLQLILSHIPQNLILKPIVTNANQERNLKLIKQRQLDIYWSGSSKYRESELRAIKIPIYKGLLGYRLMLVKKENTHLLANVTDIESLKKFSIGQGSGWPEVKLYAENGFVVHTTTQYNALFGMLYKKRFDLFPRAIIEIWDELESFSYMDLAVEDTVLVRYPYAMYFYLNSENQTLAMLIESGFKAAIASGEFDKLFEQYIGEYIRRAQLSERVLIDLPNSLFDQNIQQQKDLFYQLN